MAKRTPDQGIIPFEHRAGTEEVPTIGGMSRLGDEAQIPLRQHHLLVNVRFEPGEMGSRPGLVEEQDVGVAACITGLIETGENTGTGGGIVAGLLAGYWYGYGPTTGDTHFLYLNPEDDQEVDPALNEARPLIKTPTSYGAGAHIWENWWPEGGFLSHHQGARGCGDVAPIIGPLHPFDFQGNTCVIGGYPEVGIFSIVAPDSGGSGALNQISNFGDSQGTPVSSCIRNEIIGGEIINVLYLSFSNGKIYRFDGTTLSLWWDAATALGAIYYWRLFCSGHELLLLGDHTVAGIDVFPSPNSGDGIIYYQPSPGSAISACTITAAQYPTNPGAEGGSRSIGFTGAARFRDKWYVALQSGPGVFSGSNVTGYGQILEATPGGAALAFTVAYAGVTDYTDSSKYSEWYGSLLVFKNDLYFVTVPVWTFAANGGCFATENPFSGGGTPPGYSGATIWIGAFDGSTWYPQAVDLSANPGFIDYLTASDVGWMISNGERLILGWTQNGQQKVNFYRENLIPAFPASFDVSNVPGGGGNGVPLGSKSAYFAIPDEDA